MMYDVIFGRIVRFFTIVPHLIQFLKRKNRGNLICLRKNVCQGFLQCKNCPCPKNVNNGGASIG
jgi:hypothetical protein